MESVLETAEQWHFKGKKFYDSKDFLAQLEKKFNFKKVAARKPYDIRRKLKLGMVIVDTWGKIGVVAEISKPSGENGWRDFAVLCRHDFAPQLHVKNYWWSMVKEIKEWTTP